jgi:hypothetical protein
MKRSTMIASLVLLVTATMLSGCIYPYWYDDGYGGGRGGGHHDGGHHDNGRH